MSYTIRLANKEDMQGVYSLIKELAIFEKEPHAVEITVANLVTDGFSEPALFKCFVAQNSQSHIIGTALFYPRYSTWKGPVIHLEDLVVAQAYRGKGIGNALLSEVVAYAKEQGVKRVSWEVLDWNEPAIGFYKSKGARVMRDWNVVQLDEKGIEAYTK